MSDVRNIEFLDLSDVDEHEQLRVRASLQLDDPSVQLPWLRRDQNGTRTDIKQVKNKKKRKIKQNETTRNTSTIHEYVDPPISSAPAVNNLYIIRDQQFHPPPVVMPPLVTSYAAHHQSNSIYYANTLSPVSSTYPQVYVIPQSTVSNAVHNYPNNVGYPYTSQPTAYPYVVTTTPIHIQNNLTTGSHIGTVEPQQHQPNYENGISPVSVAEHSEIVNQNCNVAAPDTIVNAVSTQPPSVATNNVSTPQEVPSRPLPSSSLVVENGIQNKSTTETTNTSSSASKSWASLFNSGKPNNVVGNGNEAVNGGTEKVAFNKAVNKETINNGTLCPIKHPRRSQFVDPDCYRMGEYLLSYAVDGRATSLQPRGLINQSNYCYINSILQALVACPPLYNLLSGLSKNISSNEKRKPTPVIDGMCRFVKEFNHLPANMRVNNRRSEGKNQKKDQGIINTDIPFEPSWIYKMLNGIRTDLIEGRQEDAEEFLGCLLNGLNDEMLELIKLVKNDIDEPQQVTNNSESENELDKEWQIMGPKNKGSVTRRTDFGKTPISDIFGGFLKSRIHRTGDRITENIQPFFTLQLNIEKVKTVREALEALVTKYQLEGLTSSKTNEEVEAWQQVMLDELPIILVLHLKCFDFKLDGCAKIIKALEFPIDLKIDTKLLSSKTQTQKEKQYKLFAVVYHDGKEATKGHYVTDAFHVGYSSWLRYDDASVKPVQEEHVLKPQGTRVPYLLFYRRSDTIRSK